MSDVPLMMRVVGTLQVCSRCASLPAVHQRQMGGVVGAVVAVVVQLLQLVQQLVQQLAVGSGISQSHRHQAKSLRASCFPIQEHKASLHIWTTHPGPHLMWQLSRNLACAP